MMKILKYTFALSLCLSVSSIVQGKDIDHIKNNYVNVILAEQNYSKELIKRLSDIPKETIVADDIVVELMKLYPLGTDTISALIKTMRSDGSWEDIDYKSASLSRWPPLQHTERILALAKAYKSKTTKYYHSQQVEKAIHLSLDYWFESDLKCQNWWYNDIGIPKSLGTSLLLFENMLTPKEKQQGLKILSRSKIKYTGQNKVWLAGNVLIRSLLENDYKAAKEARNSIASEIRNDRFEGIKSDFSFHQHGAQQQFGNYGMSFIHSMAVWAQIFDNTSLSFDQKQLDILSALVNNGYSRILWNKSMDISSLGRQLFHQGQHHKAFAVVLSAHLLSTIDIKNHNRYKEIIDAYLYPLGNRQYINKQGHYHFWMSDYTIHRMSNSMISVKMASNRITGTEAGNGDNLKGYYLADGATYLYQHGDEYYDIYPCWDWRKIPGITSYETDYPIKQLTWNSYKNKADFVGNVNDGNTGISALDLNRDGLNARKAWIFMDDFTLCLGTGIKSDSGLVVTTSVEQRLTKGNLLYLKPEGWDSVSRLDINDKNEVRFYHDHTGYILLDNKQIKATTEERIGKWNEIMDIYPSDMIAKTSVTSIWIDHGASPNGSSYQYIILPNVDKQAVGRFNTESVRVLANTSDLQVVLRHKTKTWYFVAYKNLSFSISDNLQVKTDKPGLFILKQLSPDTIEVMASDPSQTYEKVIFSIGKSDYVIDLPKGDMKGSSVIFRVNI